MRVKPGCRASYSSRIPVGSFRQPYFSGRRSSREGLSLILSVNPPTFVRILLVRSSMAVNFCASARRSPSPLTTTVGGNRSPEACCLFAGALVTVRSWLHPNSNSSLRGISVETDALKAEPVVVLDHGVLFRFINREEMASGQVVGEAVHRLHAGLRDLGSIESDSFIHEPVVVL